jgi:hypothetical protein
MNSRTLATRRAFVGGISASAIVPTAFAQQPTAATGTPPSVISNPPRQWGWRAPPNIYPDPDVIVIDPSFAALRVGNVQIRRIATGFTWAEGPAWSSEGQYFVFSDVVGNAISRAVGRSSGDAVPQALEQQQRQLVRLPGAPNFDRGLLPSRDSLGTRRHDDSHRRAVRRQAAEFTERPGAASRWQHLVYRPALR